METICEAVSAAGGPASVLLANIMPDLSEWLESAWAVAATLPGEAQPVYTSGLPPDRDTCLRHLSGIAAALPEPELPRWWEAGSDRPEWMPRLALLIEIGGETSVLAFGPKRGAGGYLPEDRTLVMEAAAHIAGLLETEQLSGMLTARMARMNRIREDLVTAGGVQRCFYPLRAAEVTGLDYYGECRPGGRRGRRLFRFRPDRGQCARRFRGRRLRTRRERGDPDLRSACVPARHGILAA
jgi:hypothetical protein